MNHRDTMFELARANKWQRGIEIGLGHGRLLERFLSLGIDMIGVDLGLRPDRLARLRSMESNSCRLLIEPSAKAHRHVENGWADFIFIDAAHSYDAVKSDIAAWLPKLRVGGWFGGHDYHEAFPGVIRAVDESFPHVDILDGWIWTTKESK